MALQPRPSCLGLSIWMSNNPWRRQLSMPSRQSRRISNWQASPKTAANGPFAATTSSARNAMPKFACVDLIPAKAMPIWSCKPRGIIMPIVLCTTRRPKGKLPFAVAIRVTSCLREERTCTCKQKRNRTRETFSNLEIASPCLVVVIIIIIVLKRSARLFALFRFVSSEHKMNR